MDGNAGIERVKVGDATVDKIEEDGAGGRITLLEEGSCGRLVIEVEEVITVLGGTMTDEEGVETTVG